MVEWQEKLREYNQLKKEGALTQAQFEDLREQLFIEYGITPPPRNANKNSIKVIEGYKLINLIGEGGQGRVFRAIGSENHKEVAIKLLHRRHFQNPKLRKRFIKEAHTGKRANHPNIVTILDVINTDKELGLVMELIKGKPLSKQIPKRGLPLHKVYQFLYPIAEALDYMHSLNIIHRDIKPDNICTRSDGSSVLIDLGIAKDIAIEESLNLTEHILGTVIYMSPEQMHQEKITPKSDLYSFGVVLYEMLAGAPPWDSHLGLWSIRDKKKENKFTSLHRKNRNLSREVSKVVHYCLHADPRKRPLNCVKVMNNLARLIDGKPTPEFEPEPEHEAKKPKTKQITEPTIEPMSGDGGGDDAPYQIKGRDSTKQRTTSLGLNSQDEKMLLMFLLVLLCIGALIFLLKTGDNIPSNHGQVISPKSSKNK